MKNIAPRLESYVGVETDVVWERYTPRVGRDGINRVVEIVVGLESVLGAGNAGVGDLRSHDSVSGQMDLEDLEVGRNVFIYFLDLDVEGVLMEMEMEMEMVAVFRVVHRGNVD